MIGGFVVQGTGAKRVITRAIGPERTQHGITNTLANGGIINSSQVSDIQNSGHTPTAARESAIVANLQPGNNAAIVRGVNNIAGVALAEVYDLN